MPAEGAVCDGDMMIEWGAQGTAPQGERGEPGFVIPGENFARGDNEYLKGHEGIMVLLQPLPLVAGQKVNVAATTEARKHLKC